MSTSSRKLTWLFDKNAQLRDDHLEVKWTWQQESAKRELLIWLFMKPIEHLSLKDWSCIKLTGQIRLRERTNFCGELELRNRLFQQSRAIYCQEIEELRRMRGYQGSGDVYANSLLHT